MTFLHKLAQRLARLRAPARLAVATALISGAVAGCEKPISVTSPGPTLARLVVSPKMVVVRPSQAALFRAVGVMSTGDTGAVASVSWSASGGTIADSSTSSGVHYGHYLAATATGQYQVIATGQPGGKEDTAVVTVSAVPVAAVSVQPASANVARGGTLQLSAVTKDSAGNSLTGRVVGWTSSAPATAGVSASGLVTGTAIGSATITATSEGQSGTATITVVNVSVASVTVTPASTSVLVGTTVQLTATPKDSNGNPLSGQTITWGSSTTAVATVSATGLVTGVAAGSATVTATSGTRSGTAAITVTNAGSGSWITDPNVILTEATIPKPGYLVPISPSPFGLKLTRIANDPGQPLTLQNGSGTWGSDARQHYSKDQPWSADGAFLAIQNSGSPGYLYLDGNTYVPLRGECSGYSYDDDRWHPTAAHAHERINVHGSALEWFDITTCTQTRGWSLPFSVVGLGMGEGNVSFDGRYVALSDGASAFLVDMDPQPPYAPYPSSRIGPTVSLTDCGLSGGCSIDWVSVSPSGKYVVVVYNGDHLRVYAVNPATLGFTPLPMPTIYPNCAGTAAQGFIYDVGHADMTLNPFDAGEDVIAGQEHCGNAGKTVAGMLIGGVMMVRLRDGAITPLTDPTNEAYPHHVSTRNYDRPGWAYVGYYYASGQRFSNEIIAVKLDGSKSVERIAHSHTDDGCYRCEAHAVPSRDGLRVLFASDWMVAGSGTGSTSITQAYVVDTRP